MAKREAHFAYEFIRNKDENREFQKYALLYALNYFLLYKKNYLAISHIYAGMNLYDNSELLRLMHSEGRGTGAHLNRAGGSGWERTGSARFSGPELSLSFSTNIYEDIIKLAADNVVTRRNDSLLSMMRYFVDGALDMKNDLDVIFVQYYHLFLKLYGAGQGSDGGNAAEVSYSFASDFYKDLFEREPTLRERNANRTLTQIMAYSTMGSEIEKGGFLAKTTQEMLRAIAGVLKAGSGMRVYSELRRFHPAHVAGAAEGGFLRRQYSLFSDVLKEYGYSDKVFCCTAAEWTDRRIYARLQDIVAAYYPTALNMQLRENPKAGSRPSLRYFPPAVYVLIELYYLLLADSAVSGIAALQEDYYRDFNFDKITQVGTIHEMKDEAVRRQGEIEKLTRRCRELEQSVRAQESVIRASQKDAGTALHEEYTRLQQENERLRSENAALARKAQQQEEYIHLLEMPEEEAEAGKEEQPQTEKLSESELGYLMTKHFLFVGGQPDIVQKLTRQFPTAAFAMSETQQISLEKVDCIVFLVRSMSHALYYKYIETARSRQIPVIYCSNRNYGRVLRTIYDKLTGENRK